MAIGHPVYMDFVPESIFPANNAQPTWESFEFIDEAPRAITPQPQVLIMKSDPLGGPFAVAGLSGGVQGLDEFTQRRQFYGVANTHYYMAPAEPVRYDYFQQQAQAARVAIPIKQISGAAPTRGIYTGYGTYGGYTGTGDDY